MAVTVEIKKVIETVCKNYEKELTPTNIKKAVDEVVYRLEKKGVKHMVDEIKDEVVRCFKGEDDD
jgi:hypothetical protein